MAYACPQLLRTIRNKIDTIDTTKKIMNTAFSHYHTELGSQHLVDVATPDSRAKYLLKHDPPLDRLAAAAANRGGAPHSIVTVSMFYDVFSKSEILCWRSCSSAPLFVQA